MFVRRGHLPFHWEETEQKDNNLEQKACTDRWKQGERWKYRNMATKSNITKGFERVGDYTTTQ